MPNRVSLATQFTGNYKHLKRKIKGILKSRKVGHILQTTQVNDNQKLTSLFMEGESTYLYAVQAELVSHLLSIYPGICIQDWQEMASDSPLCSFHIAPTPGSLSKDSSGFVEELKESLDDQNQQPEQPKWKEYFDSGFIQIVNAIQNGRQVAYEIQSSFDSIKEKFVHVTYKTKTAHLNIGACIGWAQLKQVIQDCEILDIKNPIRKIYSLVDGEKSFESDWHGLKAEARYYVQTEDELIQNSSLEMEEFYEKLESTLMNPVKKEGQMKEIRDAFDSQDIEYDQLMATGDLTLTDGKLKEIGISQMGLRTAILSVIKSNH
jgi:hypothetical protein